MEWTTQVGYTQNVLWSGKYCIAHTAKDAYIVYYCYTPGEFTVLNQFSSLEQAKQFVEMHYAVGA